MSTATAIATQGTVEGVFVEAGEAIQKRQGRQSKAKASVSHLEKMFNELAHTILINNRASKGW